MTIRKSVRNLSDTERSDFVNAVLSLKGENSTSISGVSTYDTYVAWHVRAMENATPWTDDDPADTSPTRRNSAHRGPAFLPWHREFLRRFEADLQRISNNSDLAIPYWDWENDSTFPAFLGGNGALLQVRIEEPVAYFMPVNEGPFRFNQIAPTNGWVAVDGAGAPVGPLQRTFGLAEVPQRDPVTELPVFDPTTGQPVFVPVTLPNVHQVQHALGITEYDASPWDESGQIESFRNVLEGWWRGPRLHNQVHVWIGGSMGPGTSPNDPIFFLHHCNVDRLWADWQNRHPTASYEPQSGGPQGHNLGDPMFPWDGVATPDRVTPRDVVSLGNVSYAPAPP